MALPIKSIPTLTGKVAEDFIRMADENLKQKSTINFDEQRKSAERILIKANLKQSNQKSV